MATAPQPTLQGERVRLEPLSTAHVTALARAAGADRTSYGYASVPSGQQGTEQYVINLLTARDAGETMPFTQVDVRSGEVVGATRLLNLRCRGDGSPFAAEVGGTWLAASAQRTGINTEAKLLLMSFAFEQLGVERADIKTDARNAKARNAIAALGTTFEGVLRQWQPSQVPGEENLLRDTAMYSVVKAEWPGVRLRLTERLAGLP